MAGSVGAGALALGVTGVGLCWWFPFGAALGACGCGLGVVSWLARGGRRAALGAALGAAAVGSSSALAWNEWVRWFGG